LIVSLLIQLGINMHKLHGMKVVAASAIALLSVATIAVSGAFAQDTPKPVAQENQKPAAQDNQKPAAQTEPMSCCGCCKKMAAQKPNDNQNKMPGMNHPTPAGK
jgi:Na+-transporting methylmalonyl-CoA/oxaloacetate decarboxylase gamma subunit